MDLVPGERVIFSGHPSWRSILGFYIQGALLTAGAAVAAGAVSKIVKDDVRGEWIALTVVIAYGIVLLVGLIRRIATTYTITNKRLRIKRGIVARRTQETHLERVQNVNTRQSVLERLLRVGTVDFDTAGTGDADFAFVGVASPEEVVRAVDGAQRAAAAEPAGPEPAGPSPAGPSPAGP